MRKNLTLLVLITLVSSVSLAFPAEIQILDRTASKGDPARFNITVENNYSVQENFRISSITSPPVTTNWFQYEYRKTVETGGKKGFLVEVEPEGNPIQQNYAFTANVRSFRNKDLRKLKSYFTVSSKFDLRFDSFQVSRTEVKPGEKVNVSTTVENTASKSLKNFSVQLEAFNSTKNRGGAVLGSGDSIRYNFNLEIPERSRPGNETISVTVFNQGREARSVSQKLTVGKVRKIEKETDSSDRLLQNTYIVEVTNKGNVKDSIEIKRSLPVYSDPLTDFHPEPEEEISEGGEQVYFWNLELEPGETREISYTVDYTPALGFIGLLFIGIIGMKKFQTDLKISKNFRNKGSHIKIQLEIENSSSTRLRDLRVKDFVPDIAEVPGEFEMAKPVRTKTSNGTRLEWEIENLESGEQRVLEYKVKPIVEVEGGVELPPAEITREGRKVKESSKLEVDFQPE